MNIGQKFDSVAKRADLQHPATTANRISLFIPGQLLSEIINGMCTKCFFMVWFVGNFLMTFKQKVHALVYGAASNR